MLIILVGLPASGKSTVMKSLVKNGVKPILQCTTRPRRNRDEGGYKFVSNEDFKNIDFVEKMCYNVKTDYGNDIWLYGTERFVMDESKDYVLTTSIKNLYAYSEYNPYVVYLNTPVGECVERLLKRGDNQKEIVRRIKDDGRLLIDFENSPLCDKVFTNESSDEIVNRILDIIKDKRNEESASWS